MVFGPQPEAAYHAGWVGNIQGGIIQGGKCQPRKNSNANVLRACKANTVSAPWVQRQVFCSFELSVDANAYSRKNALFATHG